MPPKRGKAPGAHAKCDPVPVGTVIVDTRKQEISVGKEIAQGGFGRICDAKVAGLPTPCIIKLEPVGNGPLFTEINVFQRALVPTALSAYQKEKKLKFLGLPSCISSGVEGGMRFLVMPKYKHCLNQLLRDAKVFPAAKILDFTKCLLDALEYLHSKDFVHADIKPLNVMLDSKTDLSKCTLIDFGLAKRITTLLDKDNPKRAHNGTAVFTSIDAHRGCGPSYRGDLEILAYNVLCCALGELPWQAKEADLEGLKKAKTEFNKSVETKISKLVKDAKVAAIVKVMLEHVASLQINDKIDFARLNEQIFGEAPKSRRTTRAKAVEETPTTRSKQKRLKDDKDKPVEVSDDEAAKPAVRAKQRRVSPVASSSAKPPLRTRGNRLLVKSEEELNEASKGKMSERTRDTTPPTRTYPTDANSVARPEKSPSRLRFETSSTAVTPSARSPRMPSAVEHRAHVSHSTRHARTPMPPIHSSPSPSHSHHRRVSPLRLFNGSPASAAAKPRTQRPTHHHERRTEPENQSPERHIEPIDQPVGCTIC